MPEVLAPDDSIENVQTHLVRIRCKHQLWNSGTHAPQQSQQSDGRDGVQPSWCRLDDGQQQIGGVRWPNVQGRRSAVYRHRTVARVVMQERAAAG